MAYQATVLKVMIASPGDVAEERKIVTEEIYRWNDAHAEARNIILQPVKWETHSTPRLGQPPQTEINEQIAESADVLIGIFGNRIGTPTERHVSGTVEEIQNHVAAGKPAKVYFSEVPVRLNDVDLAQHQAVQVFRRECESMGLYAIYADHQTFRLNFKQHLDIELNAPQFRMISSRQASAIQSASRGPSSDAMHILSKAVAAEAMIDVRQWLGGKMISVGEVKITDDTPRSFERWRDAVYQLRNSNYVRETSPDSGVFQVTEPGYVAAEKAEAAKPTIISAEIVGDPGSQEIEIKASKKVRLMKIEYLHSTEVKIASQDVDAAGTDFKVKLEQQRIVELNNSSRPDKNNYDHSGPVKVRLVFEVGRERKMIVLSAHIQPKMVAHNYWATLIGSGEATL